MGAVKATKTPCAGSSSSAVFHRVTMADPHAEDMGLADFGRNELAVAEMEMPSLMAAHALRSPGAW